MAKKKSLIRWYADILLAIGDELNLNLPKFSRRLYSFCHQALIFVTS